MSGQDAITALCAGLGFAIGYWLARWITKDQLMGELKAHVQALREVGRLVSKADTPDYPAGSVPWQAVEDVLDNFPGEKDGKK